MNVDLWVNADDDRRLNGVTEVYEGSKPLAEEGNRVVYVERIELVDAYDRDGTHRKT